MHWQYCRNVDLCVNVLVSSKSNKTLRSLAECLVPMVLRVAMDQDNRFNFLVANTCLSAVTA